MTSRKRKAAVLATVSLLADRFPAAFFVFEGRRRPLKIGIAADICEAVPEINKEHLQWALARYCMSPGYLRSLASGAARVESSFTRGPRSRPTTYAIPTTASRSITTRH